jgi:hypothetical protein
LWLGKDGASLWTYARRDVFGAMLRCVHQHLVGGVTNAPIGLVCASLDEDPGEVADAQTEDGKLSRHDLIVGTTTGDEIEIARLVQEFLAMLTDEDERRAVQLFMAGESMEAIGCTFGKSRFYARDLVASAIATMRERAS